MRGIELQTITHRKSRFSLGAVNELDVAGRGVQVSSQQNPQSPSREHKRLPQMRETEPVRAVCFIGREKRPEPFDHCIRRVGRDRPNMHCTTGEFMLHVSR